MEILLWYFLVLTEYLSDQMCHLGLKLIKEVTYVISHLYKSIFKYDDFISYLLNFLSFLASSLLEIIVYYRLFQSSAIILDDKVRYTTFGYWRRLKIINLLEDKFLKLFELSNSLIKRSDFAEVCLGHWLICYY